MKSKFYAKMHESEKAIKAYSNNDREIECLTFVFGRFETSSEYPNENESKDIIQQFVWQCERYQKAVSYVKKNISADHRDTHVDFHYIALIHLYDELIATLRSENPPQLNKQDKRALRKLTHYLDEIYKDLGKGLTSTRWDSYNAIPTEKCINELTAISNAAESYKHLSPGIKALIGGIIGAVVGAVIGAVIGTAVTIHLGGTGGVIGAFMGMFKGFKVGAAIFTGATAAGLLTGSSLGFFKGRHNKAEDKGEGDSLLQKRNNEENESIVKPTIDAVIAASKISLKTHKKRATL